ncbi:VWFA and cache domain-containing protein 1 [Lingula anatina]|uniref:VWFA and cache domain-containing protein 1 n=1 Tax=Lingula anatina TaxID=7574 RepID=A0A1S3K8E2_LINAN|nr:VWFA and cache domain-containing protein 1 [Lingula anatina]|eukprot:XP_013418905.1 VWFA and cache domain-containing protein 1 [Lingula anatina]
MGFQKRQHGVTNFPAITLVLLAVIMYRYECSAGLIDGHSMGQILDHVVHNALGVSEMQAAFDQVGYNERVIDGPRTIQELAAALQKKFAEPVNALLRVKNAIERQYVHFTDTNTMDKCCNVTGNLVYDFRFRTKINTDESCVSTAALSPPNLKFPTALVHQTMKENLAADPTLKWQYFGMETGVFMSYPSQMMDDCESYDPRYRPWYAEAATQKTKAVVIVIDTSRSMGDTHNGRTLLEIAKEAAKSAVDTMNPNDSFAIVAFSDSATTPRFTEHQIVTENVDTCYETKMSRATPMNAKNLKKFIDGLSAGGATNYAAALTKAFEFLRHSNTTAEEPSILFLTDGILTAGGDPLQTIRDQNALLGNKVVILTFGIGRSLGYEGRTVLYNMAIQSASNPAYGPIKRGRFAYVADPDHLRSAMSSYYDYFCTIHQNPRPIFSVPYLDSLGLGLVTSLCLPVFYADTLVGVTCSDVTLSDLLTDISTLREGEVSYAFVIDGAERTIFHPLLPKPYNVESDQIFININQLEKSTEFKEVVQSMARGNHGSKSFVSTRVNSRGDDFREGVHAVPVYSHYFWHPIIGTNFSVCLVLGDGDRVVTLKMPDTITPEMFKYHRLDLKPGESQCRHFARVATTTSSTVMFGPIAFKKLYLYLDTNETLESVHGYESYLMGNTTDDLGLKDSVKASVAITYQAEQIWKNKQLLSHYVVWRYIGTVDGVVRVFPGVQLSKNFDVTQRQWFKRTATYNNKNVLTAPYLDAWGAGFVVTLSHAIYDSRYAGKNSSSGEIVAVMATDMTVNYLDQIVQLYGPCKSATYRCFIIDSAGYLVFHPYFVTVSDKPQVATMHMLFQEPAVGYDLVQKGILRRESCVDLEAIKERHYWWVHLQDSAYPDGVDNMGRRPSYELRPITNSNVFFVIRQHPIPDTHDCLCDNYMGHPGNSSCLRDDEYPDDVCECPCYRNALFNYCDHVYNISHSASSHACTPQTPDLTDMSSGEFGRVQQLKPCYDIQCANMTTQDMCYSMAGCSWCQEASDGSQLTTPFCATQFVCYFGRIGQTCPYDNCPGDTISTGRKDQEANQAGENGDNIGIILGGLFGSMATVGIFAAACNILFQRMKSRRRRRYARTRRGSPTWTSPAATSPSTSDQSQSLPAVDEIRSP